MDDQLLPSRTYEKNYLFYSRKSVNEDLLQKKGGKWTLFAPSNIKKLDRWWIVLQKLCNNDTLIAIQSSTATDRKFCLILCYTSDYENERDVKKAADEIRRVIDYEYRMQYRVTKYSTENNHDSKGFDVYLYVHTMTGEFFKKEIQFLLPSDVDVRKLFYYYGPNSVKFSEEEKKRTGNWTLQYFDGMKEADKRFIALRRLCDNGTLKSIGSTTVAYGSAKGWTTCFTLDFDSIEVKKAADEIRKIIDYKYALFYETKQRYTTVRQRDFSFKDDCKYMHTVQGGFYKKDKFLRWIRLDLSKDEVINPRA